jgi:Fe-S-cluster containining protein
MLIFIPAPIVWKNAVKMVIPAATEPRHEKFGYICHRCLNCCHDKHIQINPYEVARLARNREQTTSEFRAASTVDGAGTVLKQTETGACVFLGAKGCTVYVDRPLVCRIYPLGRHVLSDGTEWFSRKEPHPHSAGELICKGTIAEYLESQGAAPFLQAADEYFSWLCAALGYLDGSSSSALEKSSAEDAELASPLYDMDTALAWYCTEKALQEPTKIEDRKRLHLAILYRQLGDHHRSPK